MAKSKRDDIIAAFLAIDSHFTKKSVNDALSSIAYRLGAAPWKLFDASVLNKSNPDNAADAQKVDDVIPDVVPEVAPEVPATEADAEVAARAADAEPIVVDEPTEAPTADDAQPADAGDDGEFQATKKRKTATPSAATLAARAERERLAAEAKAEKLAAKNAERDAKAQQREQEKVEREAKRLAEKAARDAAKEAKEAEKAEKAAAIAAEKAEKAAAVAAERASKDAESAAKKQENEEKNAQRLAEKAARDAKLAVEAAKKEKQKAFMSNFVSKTSKPGVEAAPLEQADDGPRFKPAQYNRETTFAQRPQPPSDDAAARVEAALAAEVVAVDGGAQRLLREFVQRCAGSKPRFGNFVSTREHDRTPGHVMKLFRYSEDNRPPYRGTWSRVSSKVSARRPFARDEEHLDYDYDSDADYVGEDDEAGENLSDADDAESDDGGVEEEDEQGGFVVNDGYLSADEGLDDDGARIGEDENATASARAKPRAPREHASRLTPTVVGPAVAPTAAELQWRQLQRYRIVPHKPTQIRPLVVDAVEAAVDPIESLPLQASSGGADASTATTATAASTVGADGGATSEKAAVVHKRSTIPEQLLPEVLKLMNGSVLNKEALVDAVRAAHPTLTRISLERVLTDSCIKEKRNGIRGYFVKSDVCAQHGIDEIIDTAPKVAPKAKKRTLNESNVATGTEKTTPKKRPILFAAMLTPESAGNPNAGGVSSGAIDGGETAAGSVGSTSGSKAAMINDEDF
jgi:hypothetical protein